MKKNTFLLIVLAFATCLPMAADAQSYSLIDSNLGLYCADLPDATNALVSVTYSKGLSYINPLDPDAEKVKISKLVKDLQKRITSLKKIKKDYDPSSDVNALKKIYKFVTSEVINDVDDDDTLDKLGPSRIYKKIGVLIAQLDSRRSELLSVYDTIDRCMRNENLIPPPTAPSVNFIYFSFTHPDYGTQEYMRGKGFSAILNKKRSSGQLCVALSKTHSRISKWPKESNLTVNRNPCLSFYQTAFRKFPFCHYGAHEDTAAGWFSYTEPGFNQTPIDEKEIASANKSLDFYAPIYVRVPTKKNPCRTGG